MTYLRTDESEARLGFFGCGPGCSCGQCRASSRLGELYVRDDEADEPEPVGDWELAASITADDLKTGSRCQADERRILHPVDPAGADLASVDRQYFANPRRRKGIQLHRAAYSAYVALKRAAEADGIPPRILTIVSGYRGKGEQTDIWQKALRKYGSPEEARKWAAPPGHSPHQSGRAIDFWLGTSNDSRNVPALRRTNAYRWLVCNAARFGFTPYAREPWHWEFNPPGAAVGTAPSMRASASTTATPRAPQSSRLGETPTPQAGIGLGTLIFAVPGRPRFAYRFTPDDELWATRFIVGEAGGRDNPDNQAVLWAMFNRYALFTHRVYPTFASFIRRYSTTLQPVLRSPGAARRHMNKPQFVRTGGTYPPPNQDVPQGQLRRHLDLQKAIGSQLPAPARALVRRAMSGEMPNPIGNASEFANTAVYFRDRHRRLPTEAEWRDFTINFARSKRWTWIGPVAGLAQVRSNAFFVDRRAANLPRNAVQVTR